VSQVDFIGFLTFLIFKNQLFYRLESKIFIYLTTMHGMVFVLVMNNNNLHDIYSTTHNLKNLTPEFFFAECERQYFFERAIEKKMTAKEYLENKLNNSSKRKRSKLAKEIRTLR
jgi:hypothetical protein